MNLRRARRDVRRRARAGRRRGRHLRGPRLPARRAARSCRSPSRATRATFRYDGLDGHRRSTHVAFSEPGAGSAPIDGRRATRRAGGCDPLPLGVAASPPARARADAGRLGRPSEPAATRPASSTATRTATLFPEPPRIAPDEGAAAYHAWTRGTTAVQTDNELFNLTVNRSARRPAPAGERRARRRASATSRQASRGSRRCSGATRSSPSLQTLAFRPQIAVETLAVLAALQATEVDDVARRRARQDPPRAADRRDGRRRRAAALAVLRQRRRDAALADPARRDVRLDRRPRPSSTGSGRTRWPRSSWIDEWGDRDGDGFVEYERRSERGLLNQGWKDSGDAIRDRHGAEARRADRPRRGPGLRLRRQAPDGAARPDARRGRAGRRASTARPTTLREPFEEAFWVEDQRYYAMALDGEKRQARRDRLERRPVPVDRDRLAGPGPRRRRPAAGPGAVLRLGRSGPTPPTSRATTRSATTPARSGRTTRR